MANITEANYDGYARQEVVWYPTYQDLDGAQQLDGVSQYFSPVDSLIPLVITGMFMASALTGGTLWMQQPIGGAGYPLGGPTGALVVVPSIQFSPTGNFGGAVVQP